MPKNNKVMIIVFQGNLLFESERTHKVEKRLIWQK